MPIYSSWKSYQINSQDTLNLFQNLFHGHLISGCWHSQGRGGPHGWINIMIAPTVTSLRGQYLGLGIICRLLGIDKSVWLRWWWYLLGWVQLDWRDLDWGWIGAGLDGLSCPQAHTYWAKGPKALQPHDSPQRGSAQYPQVAGATWAWKQAESNKILYTLHDSFHKCSLNTWMYTSYVTEFQTSEW